MATSLDPMIRVVLFLCKLGKGLSNLDLIAYIILGADKVLNSQ